MDAHKISVKFFVEDASNIGEHEFGPIFHSWIQAHAIPDHLLIDVADYAHVHNGPGTVLVSDEANFYADRTEGLLGFTYARKRKLDGSFFDRLTQATAASLQACALLEDDGRLANRIKFRTDEIAICIHDRLLAPNTPEVFQQVKPEIERLATTLYPGVAADVEHYQSPATLFEVRVRFGESNPLSILQSRLRLAATAPSR